MSLKPYPKYKDSGVAWLGDVPEHWNVKRLKYVCNVFPSNVDKKSYDDGIPVRLCNYTDVYYNETINEQMELMTATATAGQIAKFTLRAGDVIITKDSETADDIAIPAYVPTDLPNVVCGYHLSMVRVKNDNVGLFIKRLFDGRYLKSKFEVLANGLTRVGLGQYALDNVEIPLPSAAEQTTIANFLDHETRKIDALIAEQQQLIVLLAEKRQATISHAVTKGLNPKAPMKDSGVVWLGEVPEHWATMKVARAFPSIGSGTTPKSDNALYYDDENGTPWLNTGDLNDGDLYSCSKKVSDLAIKEHSTLKIYPPNSVVIAMYGATIGKLAILKFSTTVNQACCVFGVSEVITKDFIFYWLFGLRAQIISLATGGGQPNISQDVIKNLFMAAPCTNEQTAIANYLDVEISKLDTLQTEANNVIALLKERRTALISAAVTGKIDVRGWTAPQNN